MKIGPRIWKTGLAVAVAISACRLLGLQLPIFAGVAAIICMQPTIAGSVRSGMDRMQATIMGAGIALLSLMLMQSWPYLEAIRPIMVGLTVILVMVIAIRLRWMDSLVLAAATVVVVMDLPPDANIYRYAASRTVITFIGIVVATMVNALFATPSYSRLLWQDMSRLTESAAREYRQAVEAFCFRKADLARATLESLPQTHELMTTVRTSLARIQQESAFRNTIRLPNGHDVDALERIADLLESLRQCTENISLVTAEVLERVPLYVEEQAPVYGILWDLAQPGLGKLDHIVARLNNLDTAQPHEWTDSLHARFIQGIREADRERYPLVETSVVEFQIRRATQLLAEMDGCIDAAVSGRSLSG